MLLLWAAAVNEKPVPVQDIPPPPSLELLEFLGRFEDAEGSWMDPMLLENPHDAGEQDGDEEHHDEADTDQVDPDSAGDRAQR